MPNFIALEMNHNVMVVACAKGLGKSFQINHLFQIPTEGLTDQQRGVALKEALAEKGVAKSELIGVVNRQQVEMREVSVPPAPDNELPNLIRFQARNVFASMNDNWKLDYVPFQARQRTRDGSANAPADGQIKVLAIAIPPSLYDEYHTVSEAAGLKLKRIVFGPYSWCSLYEPLMIDGDNRLLIVPAAEHFDFAVTAGSELVAARSIRPLRDGKLSARQITGEVRRTIANTLPLLGDEAVQQILIAASETNFAEMGAEVGSSLDLPVSYLDVFATLQSNQISAPQPESPEHFAAVIGSLALEYSSKRQPVDFVNPRRPVVRQRNYQPLLIAAAAAALIALISAAYAWFSLNSQYHRIAEKQKELNQIKAENDGQGNLTGIDQMIGEVKELDDWEVGRANWLEELSALSGLLLTPDDIIVTSFRGEPANDGGVRINLGIRTTKETNMTPAWKQTLFDRYDVKAGDSTPDNADSDYPFSSRLTLTRLADQSAIIERITAEADRIRLQEIEAETAAESAPASAGSDPEPSDDRQSTAE